MNAIQKHIIKLIRIKANLACSIPWPIVKPHPPFSCIQTNVCCDELRSPSSLNCTNTRFSNAQHPMAFKLDRNHTNAFANAIIPYDCLLLFFGDLKPSNVQNSHPQILCLFQLLKYIIFFSR